MKDYRIAWMIAGAIVAGLQGSCKPSETSGTEKVSAKETIHAVGYLEPREKLRRLAFQSYGVITEIHPKIGESVKAGDVIAQLNDGIERSALASAEAKLSMAEANRKLGLAGAHPSAIAAAEAAFASASEEERYRRHEVERMEGLADKRALSTADWDAAVFQSAFAASKAKEAAAFLEQMRNQVREEDSLLLDAEVIAARSEVAAAEEAVRQKQMIAPLAGTVAEIFLREGEAVSPSLYEPIILLAPAGAVDVRAEVDQNFAKDLRTGMVAQVRVNKEREWKLGKVRAVKPIMGRKTVFSREATERMDIQIIEVWIELDKPLAAPLGAEVDVEIMR